MRWTCVVTRSHYWILGKNVDLSSSPSGCARRTLLDVVAFRVLSVWWKTSASVSVLFWAVLPHYRLYDLCDGKVTVSRDMIFDEKVV